MYLSQIHISKLEAAKLKFDNPYEWHKKVWGTMGKSDESRQFLFRMDRNDTGMQMLLVSPDHPPNADWGYWETKSIGDSFLSHTHYRFQVRCNPTKRIGKAGGNLAGKRMPITRKDELEKWIYRKSEQGGFDVEGLHVDTPRNQCFKKKNVSGRHISVDFSGVLCVTERDSFKHTFFNGIGSAKSFGFGMLMLQPYKK